MIHTQTISPRMNDLAVQLDAILPSSYYLAGGTALALQIGHRESVDLDYFTPDTIDTNELYATIVEKVQHTNNQKTFEAPNTLWLNVDGVKVSFIQRKQKLLNPATAQTPFRLGSLADITVMKLAAICGRDEYKDYFDLSYLAEKTDVRQWLVWWAEVAPESDPLSWLVALAHVSGVPPIPLKGDNLKPKTQVESTLKKALQEINQYLKLG